jgi:hypothetical protein
MTGNRTFKVACRCAVARAFLYALASFGIAPGIARAAAVVYDFSSPPDTTLFNGSFSYGTSGDALSATFAGLQFDDSGSFPDHTNGNAGAAFGVGPGPAVISFSAPVDLVELYVNNFSGDFDARPDESKLFSITASLGGTNVFIYDRAAASAAPDGVSDNYLLIAPAQPVRIDSISFANFDQDVLDDLKVQVVPEPASVGVAAAAGICLGGLSGRTGRGRRRRRDGEQKRGGHAPERDPPRENCGGQFTLGTQTRGVACAASEKNIQRRASAGIAVGTCT